MSEQVPENSIISVERQGFSSPKLWESEALLEAIESGLSSRVDSPWGKELARVGMPCKILAPRQEWRTGYIRVRVEFVPGELPQEQTEQ